MKKLLLISSISIIGMVLVLIFNSPNTSEQGRGTSLISHDTQFKIVSTNPSPLDGATISFTQPVEVTFNKPISISELKYKLEPELEHVFEAIDTGNKDFGATFQLKFKKPLEAGSGFQLTITTETKVSENDRLDKDYSYHVKTITHKGV